jgi:hypothetical protein
MPYPGWTSPEAVGLDQEGIAAVAAEMERVYGRYPANPLRLPWLPNGELLDDPLIRRPLEESQPVPRFNGTPEYWRGGTGTPGIAINEKDEADE